MGNIFGLMQILGMARSNPQQAVLATLQQGLQTGRINQQQYDLLAGQLQNGANPTQIIQQMLNSGMVNQQQYEEARQSAGSFGGGGRNT